MWCHSQRLGPAHLQRFPFTSPRRQTRQRLFTLPQSPAGDVLSISGKQCNAGDTGFVGEMESAPYVLRGQYLECGSIC